LTGLATASGLRWRSAHTLLFSIDELWGFAPRARQGEAPAGADADPTVSRDRVRQPMPWDRSEERWLSPLQAVTALNADWPTRNVARMAEESQINL